MQTKLIIVEDHQFYRTGIKSFLSTKDSSFSIIGEAGCAKEFFELIDNGVIPDILLLDIILPDQNGVEIARIIKKNYPNIKIVMLSSETSENLIIELSEIGINGFLSKASQREELHEALSNVVQDVPYYGKDIAKIMYDLYINKISSKTKEDGIKDDTIFTEKELDIIRLCGDGLQSKEIADKLCVSTRTVETHRRNIFKKLNISNSIELLKYGIKHGIIQL